MKEIAGGEQNLHYFCDAITYATEVQKNLLLFPSVLLNWDFCVGQIKNYY